MRTSVSVLALGMILGVSAFAQGQKRHSLSEEQIRRLTESYKTDHFKKMLKSEKEERLREQFVSIRKPVDLQTFLGDLELKLFPSDSSLTEEERIELIRQEGKKSFGVGFTEAQDLNPQLIFDLLKLRRELDARGEHLAFPPELYKPLRSSLEFLQESHLRAIASQLNASGELNVPSCYQDSEERALFNEGKFRALRMIDQVLERPDDVATFIEFQNLAEAFKTKHLMGKIDAEVMLKWHQPSKFEKRVVKPWEGNSKGTMRFQDGANTGKTPGVVGPNTGR